MRLSKVLRRVLGLGRDVVMVAWELEEDDWRVRPNLLVTVRARAGWKGRCGRCSELASAESGGLADAFIAEARRPAPGGP